MAVREDPAAVYSVAGGIRAPSAGRWCVRVGWTKTSRPGSAGSPVASAAARVARSDHPMQEASADGGRVRPSQGQEFTMPSRSPAARFADHEQGAPRSATAPVAVGVPEGSARLPRRRRRAAAAARPPRFVDGVRGRRVGRGSSARPPRGHAVQWPGHPLAGGNPGAGRLQQPVPAHVRSASGCLSRPGRGGPCARTHARSARRGRRSRCPPARLPPTQQQQVGVRERRVCQAPTPAGTRGGNPRLLLLTHGRLHSRGP